MNVNDVKVICVLGAGLMGNGIAQVFAQVGYKVYMRDIEQRFIDGGMANIKKNLGRLIAKGKMTEQQVNEIIARITATIDLKEACKDADVVIEAIVENPKIKKDVFAQVDAFTKPECIIATNTSSISITELAAALKNPKRFVGLHFFNPVPVMKLVEIIKGLLTSEETVKIVADLSKKIDKESVLIEKDYPCFAVNRLAIPFMIEAVFALQEGVASVEDLDKAVKLGLNHPMGPLTLLDFVGLDTVLHVADYMFDTFKDSKYRAPILLRNMVKAGLFGVKSGKGFYDYSKK